MCVRFIYIHHSKTSSFHVAEPSNSETPPPPTTTTVVVVGACDKFDLTNEKPWQQVTTSASSSSELNDLLDRMLEIQVRLVYQTLFIFIIISV